MQATEPGNQVPALPGKETEGAPRLSLEPPRFPLATVGMTLLILFAALAQYAAGGFRGDLRSFSTDFGDWALGAKIPSLVAHGEYWRLVTANFLHADWLHLSSNLFALVILGRLVEAFYGPARTFAVCVLSALSGAAVSFFLTPQISLGASTAVMGLLGALLSFTFRYRRGLPPRIHQLLPFLVGLVVVSLVMDFASKRTDVAGHIGGLAGGIAVSLLLGGRFRSAGAGRSGESRAGLAAAGLSGAVLLYGAFGLAVALPAQTPLLAAGRSADLAAQERHLRRVLDRKPSFLEARRAAADLLSRLGRDREAAAEYQRVRAQDPRAAAARDITLRLRYLCSLHLQQGQAFFEAERYEEALRAYERSLAYAEHPDLKAQVQNSYAWTLVDKLERDLDTAERLAREAVAAAPEESAITDTLAWVYYKQGRYREALELQQRALALARRERDGFAMGELYYHLGAIHEALRDENSAIAAYRRAVQAGGFPPAVQALSRLSPPGETAAARPETPEPRPRDPAANRGVL